MHATQRWACPAWPGAPCRAIIEAGPESLTFVFPRGINDTAACALFANGEAFQYAAGAPAFANASGAGYAARQGVIPSESSGAGGAVGPDRRLC